MSSQAEEMTSQAEELAQMAEELQAVVGQFRLDGEARGHREAGPTGVESPAHRRTAAARSQAA